jgi:hypothetical protein
LRLWRSLALATVALLAGACVDANVGKVEICDYEDKGYTLNETFPASDGCNTCKCTIDGDVECTEKACSEDPVKCDPKQGCVDAGQAATDAGHAGPYVDAGKFPSCDPKVNECYDAGVGSGWDYCKYNGTTFKPGETFRASDGCNTCVCSMTGNLSCSDKVCYEPDATVAPGTCVYANNVYKPGEYFATSDKCDKCLCTDTGVVECTRDGCSANDAGAGTPVPGKGTCSYQGKTYQVGDGFGRGDNCNKCTCAADGVIECTSNSCANAMGCTYGTSFVPVGKSLTCSDGCNTCTCNMQGIVESTLIACDPPEVISKCDASTATVQFPASLLYQQGDSLAVADSRCVNGQANNFTLCFDDLANTMGQETTVYAVAGGGSRACSGKERVYSLSALRAAYQALTGQMAGKIVLNGSGNGLVYAFGF